VRSVNLDRYPDADYTPNDIEPVKKKSVSNYIFQDLETKPEYYEAHTKDSDDRTVRVY